LQVKLLPGQQATRAHHQPGPEAYDQFLLGRHGLSMRSGDFAPAVEAFSRAIALEPDYALAYSYLGMAESFVSENTKGDDAKVDASRARARAAADKAVQLDPGLADGYSTRGYLRYTHDWDWSGARADLEFALKLDPVNEVTYLKYGYLLGMLGKLPEAVAAERRATELDPMFIPPWEQLGRFHLATGDYEAARRALNRAHAIAPENTSVGLMLPLADLLEGHSEQALAASEQIPPGRWRLIVTAIAQHQLGRNEAAQSALKELIDRHGKGYPCRVAGVLAQFGDRDGAFQWLERAYGQRDVALGEVQFDALLGPIRDDARYRALLDKMQFPR
jgi:tetratricopeptide (TPR) repeat protein